MRCDVTYRPLQLGRESRLAMQVQLHNMELAMLLLPWSSCPAGGAYTATPGPIPCAQPPEGPLDAYVHFVPSELRPILVSESARSF